jgi:hypothetical protein
MAEVPQDVSLVVTNTRAVAQSAALIQDLRRVSQHGSLSRYHPGIPLWSSTFGFRDLDRFVDGVAEQLDYYPSALCPCAIDAGQPDISHILCHGTGHIHFLGEHRTVRCLVTGFNIRYHQAEAGTAAPGDLIVSPRPRQPVQISQWDLLRLPRWQNGEPYQGDLITHPGAGNAVALTYPVQRIERVFSVNGGLSMEYQTYEEGVDFAVDSHTLTFLTDPPHDGTIISVKYRAIMEYVVVEGPTIRHERGSDLGPTFVARKREMILPFLNGSQT